MELDGVRADAPAAYAKAGQAVLERSQLVVGVWDGGKAAGVGGTAENLHKALQLHIPGLWLDTRAPGKWALLRGPAHMALSHPRQDTQIRLDEAVASALHSAPGR